MTTTAESLVRILHADREPLTPAVLVDYFGRAAADEELVHILLGVYEGLVLFKFVPADVLHDAYRTNRLDELIRAKYVHWRSAYYDLFVEKGIVIGPTCHRPLDPTLPILDDDHCATCGHVGYVTKGNRSFGGAPDCERCFRGVCGECVVHTDDGSSICGVCANNAQA